MKTAWVTGMTSGFGLDFVQKRIGRAGCLSAFFLLSCAANVVALQSGDFTYTKTATAVTITRYTGFDSAVAVPVMIGDLPVTGIGTDAFRDLNVLTSVTIPASVTSIGDAAFCQCSALTSFTIPNSVTNIGNYAFQSCSRLTAVMIGNSVTTIGFRAFDGCAGLTGLTIPNSVVSIGGDAFLACTGLTGVTFGSRVTSIGARAFEGCTGLTGVTIPRSVTRIGGGPFARCSNLSAITVAALNSAYSSVDGVLFNRGQTALIQFPGRKAGNYTIPAGVISIGDAAFFSCTGLTGVTFPASVTGIGAYAFYSCTGLTSVTIPNSVASIKWETFDNCTSLASATIGASVTSIEGYAFSGCTKLTGVYFEGNAPASVNYSAFNSCANATVYYSAGTTGWSSTLCGRPTVLWNHPLPAIILQQPRSQSVPAGKSVACSVSVLARGTSVSFQWCYNGAAIPGATNSFYFVTNMRPARAGAYSVRVNNAYGTVTSSSASLTVSNKSYRLTGWGRIVVGPSAAQRTTFTGIAAGYSHSLAIKPDGTVVAWGDNEAGQCLVPEGLSNVVSVAAGREHSMALRRDGTVISWGDSYDTWGGGSRPTDLTNVVAISAGEDFSMALRNNGKVTVWGYDYFHQRDVPADLGAVTAISAGMGNCVVLLKDGSVRAWGDNYAGNSIVPASATNVVLIAAGYRHVLALRNDGVMVSWGWNQSGEGKAPTNLNNVVALVAGIENSAALQADGKVVVWGSGTGGAYQSTDMLPPVGLGRVKAIAMKYAYFISLCDDGSIVGWGMNDCGQSDPPAGLSGLVDVVAADRIWGDDSHYLAVRTNGTVAAFGANDPGNDDYPGIAPPGLSNVVSVAAAMGDSYAVRADGTVMSWGNNCYGDCITPSGLRDVVAVCAGGEQRLALRSDGSVIPWGTGVPSGLSNFIAMAAGQYNLVGLRPDGTVAAWPKNPPFSLTQVIAIAAGRNHSMALTSDGRVYAWGEDRYSQTYVPNDLADAVAIAAGPAHSLALRADGRLVGWGDNTYGQTTMPRDLTGIGMIACGVGCSLALVECDQDAASNQVPVVTAQSPLANPAAVTEGDAVLFSVTATDDTDPDVALRGMESVTWYIDGVLKLGTTNGAPNAITSAFTLQTDTNTVQGSALMDVQVKAVALDRQGGTYEVSWVARVTDNAGPSSHPAMVGTAFGMALPEAFAGAAKVAVKGLPVGLKYNSKTRKIEGAPTKAGTYKVVISATGVPAQTVTLTVETLPAWAWGAFNGYIGEAGASTMSVTALGKVTGKIVLGGASYAFSAASYAGGNAGEGFVVSAVAKAGSVSLPLELRVTRAEHALTLGVAEGALGGADALSLYRDVWKEAVAELVPYIGYYTAALPGGAEYGSGYLTFTVDKAGKVKTAGKLADGTAVSLGGTLVLDGAGRLFAVLHTAPAAYKGGCLFGLAEFLESEVDGAKTILRPVDGAPFLWRSLNPQATGDSGAGFGREPGLTGGWYSKTENLYGYYLDKSLTVGTDAAAPVPEITVGAVREASDWWDPDGLVLTPVLDKKGVMTGLSAPKPGVPADTDKDGVWDYGATNSVGLKVTLTRATGVLKGSFSAWFDYPVRKHISKSVAYEGVLTPEREDKSDGVEGRGFFLWPDKAVPPAPAKPYGFNWSYDFLLLGN